VTERIGDAWVKDLEHLRDLEPHAEDPVFRARLREVKLANKVAKYRQGKKFIDEHGDTPEVRKALGDARGDVAKAERNLAAERERMAAEARQQQQQATKAPKPTTVKPEPPPAPAPATEPPVTEPTTVKPEPPAAPAPAPAKPRTPTKTARTVAEIERELKSNGLAPGDFRKFAGGAKRMTAAIAERVAKLMEHFTPEDVKKLGEFFSENKIALDEAHVDALIQKVPRGKMGEYVRHLEIAQTHGQRAGSLGWPAEEPTLEKTTTVHPGKPPLTREIVATPGSTVLGANLIERDKVLPPRGYHAHHIIPEKQFAEGVDWMRTRLEKAGSDIHRADNGVFLAGSRSTANPELTRLHNSYMHAGPSKEYAYTLTRRLGNLHGHKFLEELHNIAEEMRTGRFKMDEIPYGWKGKWQPGMTAPIEPGFQPGWIEVEE